MTLPVKRTPGTSTNPCRESSIGSRRSHVPGSTTGERVESATVSGAASGAAPHG
ncbi:MAG TPA: hypothetical protein VFO67_16435 [Gemmatimonadales bacterium]|nr:hypothetical protein [Gemmatimonadales bacterium]